MEFPKNPYLQINQIYTKLRHMEFIKTYWVYILAALITIIGILTGWYLFLLFVFPLGLFRTGRKDKDEDDS